MDIMYINVACLKYNLKAEYRQELYNMYRDFWKDLAKKDTNHLIKGGFDEDFLENGTIALAIQDDIVIGFARFDVYIENWCCVKNAEIIDIYIKPEYRNQGIGTKLIEEIEKYVKFNYKASKIRIAFIDGNKKAGKLYKKLGYKTNYTELIKEV